MPDFVVTECCELITERRNSEIAHSCGTGVPRDDQDYLTNCSRSITKRASHCLNGYPMGPCFSHYAVDTLVGVGVDMEPAAPRQGTWRMQMTFGVSWN